MSIYELKDKEYVFIFTGPDGSGRKTVADMVGQTLDMRKVISCTTRKPHAVEEDGQDYYFLSREEFIEEMNHGEFLENTKINDEYYGLRNKDIEENFQKAGCIYLILNRNGAETLKKLYGEKVIRVFIYADREIVRERQIKRGDTPEAVERHLSRYDEDMAYMSRCEHAFENLDLAHLIFDLTKILDEYLERNLLDLD